MDVFTLAAKLTLDSKGFANSLKNGESMFQRFGDKVKKGLTSVAKVGAMSVSAAAGALVPLVKSATEAYANYEQLVGGVETLFGAKGAKTVEEYAKNVGKSVDAVQKDFDRLKASETKVFENADNAYKTAGLSANEYMETVTSFSAALISSLRGNTEAAADVADMAIQDMSDNANKMGTDMSAIQTAYQGFAKQNYTMLDNLKLGYGGTKTEMERLLKDAQKLTGQKYNISKLADVYKAIHAIQENLGITGTTAKEANETISGSISSFKAAWENMLVAVSSGDKDISKASKTLVDTGKTVLSNVVPAIKRSVTGFGSAFKDLAPMIGRELPGLIADIVPGMIEGGWELIKGLGSGLVEAAKNMKWPSWEDVKAGAVALWDAIKAGVAEFGGLIFGKDEKGEVNWPDFSTVVDWAKTNIWDGIIVAGVKKFGGLVFGKDEEGKVNWPSFTEAFKYAKDVLWEKGVKAFVGNLGGLVFGANEKGEVNWPTWEDVVGAATKAWEKIKTEAAKMAGLLFGIKPEDSQALTTLGNTIEVIAGAIGTYAVASSIQTAFGSIVSLLKIPSANPVLLAISGIAAGAILIAQNWETIYGWIDKATQAVLNFFGIQTQFTDKDIHQANVDDLSKVTENLNNAYTVNQNNVLGMMQEFEGIAQRLNKTRAWDFLTEEQRTAINNKAYSPELMESIYVTLSDALKNEQSALTETTDSMKTLQGQVEALQSSAGTASEALISMANSMPDFSQFMVGDSNAEGSWDVPRDMTARIHKGELIMSAANARQYREGKGSGGSSVDLGGLIAQIGQTVTEAIENANINLDGKRITRSVNRNLAMDMSARRFST